ncbi:MAG: hypothetical protein ABJL99_02985 [Aliishimia sp.]
MTLIADILLAAGALGAAFYCFVLGRRLRRFNNLENGMGGAVAVLSAQVDDLEKTLGDAREAAQRSASDLTSLTEKAESVRRQLELQMASLHDVVPAETKAPPVDTKEEVATPSVNDGEPMFVRRRSA